MSFVTPRSRRHPIHQAALNVVALAVMASALAAQPPAQQPDTTRPPINQADDPALRGFRWRVIGPIGQGGRIDDIAVVERDPQVFYVGFATAGIWKTSNNGVTFAPVFDTYSTHSIGDLAIAQSNPEIVYAGTGEANNRQSSSFGDGVFKTSDGGKTWTNMGLRETQSIARVVVHPRDPNTVWVAAMGHLFTPNAERGVFKSSDGGRTWRKTLFVDNNTGATEIVIHPTNPSVLFAATYTRQRTVFGFASGGPGSGIWKSSNGGDSWTRVRGGGLPNGTMGRIGIDFSRSNPNVIYAQIEVAADKEPVVATQQQGGAGGAGGGGGGGGGFGQQNLPPDDKVSGIWRSDDGGNTWQFRSNQNNRPMYYSQIRVDPNDPNTVYVGGASASKSIDGARTFTQLVGFGHGDHHAIWIDPSNSRHVMYGNDGSLDISWDGALTWESIRTWAVGQPYHASVDMRRPYYVCTGLQDNGSWCGPSSVRSGPILSQDWYRVGGGDGFYTAVDPSDHLIMYSESQDGNMNRLDLRAATTISIRPRPGGRAIDAPQ
ncbi:MAG: WD40/YVTN/BNR-like repeat-containing protein, partial [Gemmatimonadaceae bacterium]